MFKPVLFSALTYLSYLINYNCPSFKDTNYKCYYEVGKPCPDFTFQRVENFSKKQVNLKDFAGKWLILDFWSKGCSGCIKSFPKISKEQEELKDNVQFLLIGVQDKEEGVNALWKKLQKELHLSMPAAFDSVVIQQVDELEHGLPFVVVIDPEGIVRGSGPGLDYIVTDPQSLTLKNRPVLRDHYRELYLDQKTRYSYNDRLPYLINNNGGSDSGFLFRSVLAKWTHKEPIVRPKSIYDPSGKFTVIGPDNLKDLYRYAYLGVRTINSKDSMYGKFWPEPILEIHDSSKFAGDMHTSQNIYSYSLTVPASKASQEYMMQSMQGDLYKYFGYKVKVEERRMPYWRLIANSEAILKLKSPKDGPSIFTPKKGDWTGYKATNYSMSSFVNHIIYISQVEKTFMPVINETGFEGNIDIEMNFSPFDFNSVKKALQDNGLDLVKGEKSLKVLVIQD